MEAASQNAKSSSPQSQTKSPAAGSVKKIEQHRNGYPRLAAFMATDPSFFIVRRFSILFSRNLLLKQDRLADLEAQLAQVDLKEDVQWYLSSRRGDQNAERLRILHDLDEALREYESAVSSYRRMADLRKPSSISKRDLRRWMDGNKPIVRREAEFLDHDHDLITLAEGQDRGMLDDAVEWLVGTCLPFRLGHKIFGAKATRDLTEDTHVHLYSPGRIQLFSRFIITVVIIVLLLIPMIILYTQYTNLARFLTIGVSTLLFTATLALATTANKAQILTAAATYGAVLVVYVTRAS